MLGGKYKVVPMVPDGLKKHMFQLEVIEPDNLPSKVDPVGYVDPNVRIKQMQAAGVRIDAWNKAVYDFEHEDLDDGFTMAPERDDDDELEMLASGKREMERYRDLMYRTYMDSLKAEKMAQNPPDVASEAPQKKSVTNPSERTPEA